MVAVRPTAQLDGYHNSGKPELIGKSQPKAKWESLVEADTFKELAPYKNGFLEACCRIPLVISVVMITFACCWGPLFASKLAAG